MDSVGCAGVGEGSAILEGLVGGVWVRFGGVVVSDGEVLGVEVLEGSGKGRSRR